MDGGGARENSYGRGFYLTDISLIPAVRPVRDEYVDTARPPASTAVQVGALFMPGLMIEAEAWAVCAD